MAWFLRKFFGMAAGEPDRFVAPPPEARFSVSLAAALESAMSGVAGTSVPRDQAMQVGAISRSRDLIAGTLSTLPLDMIAPGKRPIPWELFTQPDPDLARSVTFAYTFEDLLLEGEAWWRVIDFTAAGFPRRARWVPHNTVHVGGSAALPSVARITPDQDDPRDGQVFIDGIPVADREVIHFVSPNPPLLRKAARAIRVALTLEQTVEMYSREPQPLGYFRKVQGADTPSDPEVQQIIDDWDEARRRKAWGYAGGLEPVPLNWNPQQLELVGQRREAVAEIARHAGLDPEDLGVSTTSRTYANIEQRRQDLLTFTLGAYVSALQDRLSMPDVAPRGHVARVNFGGFLRTDTLGRYQAHEVGLRVGALTEDEIRELEDRPPLTGAQKARKDMLNGTAPAQVPAPAAGGRGAPNMSDDQSGGGKKLALAPLNFDNDETVRLGFNADEAAQTFQVDTERRIITGLAVPYGKVARSGFAKWKFRQGSLRWTDPSRVKLNLHHDRIALIGRATRLQDTSRGLMATFKIAQGPEGDRALALAEDQILDGMSIEVDFNEEMGDGWQPDPADESVRLVNQGGLTMVGLTGAPAFDDARVTRVAATRDEGGGMPEDKKPDGQQTATFDLDNHLKTFTEAMLETQKQAVTDLATSVGESLKEGVKAALENIHDPQNDGPEPVRPARFRVTREAPVYALNGSGPSLVRDAWHAQMSHDEEASARIRKFRAQTDDVAKLVQQRLHFGLIDPVQFATGTTGNLSEVIPPGYRPDLFVPQLAQGRPFVNALSRGVIANATPFVVPIFVSATGATGNHTEGTNPTDGTLDMGTKTVTPTAVSGLLKLTREIVDSSNPAIDQIALAAMRESYAQQTEAKVYAELNGTNGQGGTPTGGLVPSGAQVATTTSGAAGADSGLNLLRGVRTALALYPFRRFAAPDRALISQEATTAFATAEDAQNRPLLPSVGAQNTAGVGNAVGAGWFVDGLAHVPAWSITGNTATDADVFTLNSMDAWAWESPLLSFRFEERSGPAVIDLALFGYFATHLLRPVGLSAIRHTVAV